MPVVFEKQIDAAKKLAVWEITEPLDFFLEKLGLSETPGKNQKRQLEQFANLFLLNTMCEENVHAHVYKDQYGKPFILNSKTTVSFSHSRNHIACLIDTGGGPTGIDIEYKRNNILDLAQKFVSNRDKTPFEGEMNAHLIWGAKEVLYKIYGKKELDFKRDLELTFEEEMIGTIHKNEKYLTHKLEFTEINNFILVWNCEILSKNT